MAKYTLPVSLLLATCIWAPSSAAVFPTVGTTGTTLIPCEVPSVCSAPLHQESLELAAASQRLFTLIDSNSKAKVETYKLQPGWQGSGKVFVNRDPSGANMLTWFSSFEHTSGAKAYVDSERLAIISTAFSQSDYVKRTNEVAKSMAKVVAERAHASNVKVVSAKLSKCNDSQVNQLARGLQQQVGGQSKVSTWVLQSEFSFAKNNKNWKAKIRLPLLVSEARVMGNMYSTYVDHVYQEMYIFPADKEKSVLSSAQSITHTRAITREWENTVAQTRGNVSGNAINNARKQSDIWRQTGDDISNMNRDTYNKQNASQDRMSQKRSDATLGNYTTRDPFHSGRKITVKDNADYIWVNSQGQQCGSDDSNYNPNEDRRRNSTEWVQIKK